MVEQAPRTSTCPTCGKRFRREQTTAMPFCSERCRTIDLRRWLDEEHSVPAPSDFDDESADDAEY